MWMFQWSSISNSDQVFMLFIFSNGNNAGASKKIEQVS